MNVLIVDDSSLIRRSLKNIFLEIGFNNLSEAINGRQALAEFDAKQPELVTMDINMPGMDGIEVVKKMLKKKADANIIMVSSVNQKNMVFEALQNGARHYVIKPVTIEKIKKVLIEVMPEYEKKLDVKQKVGKLDHDILEEIEVQKIENDVININKKFDDSMISMLHNIIKGLLLVKPLKVFIKFNADSELQEYLQLKLDEITRMIDITGGEFRIEFLG